MRAIRNMHYFIVDVDTTLMSGISLEAIFLWK